MIHKTIIECCLCYAKSIMHSITYSVMHSYEAYKSIDEWRGNFIDAWTVVYLT